MAIRIGVQSLYRSSQNFRALIGMRWYCHRQGDPSSPQVDGFLAVIAQGGDEETAFRADPEMLDASLRVRQEDSASED
jgi:hypothetical protein